MFKDLRFGIRVWARGWRFGFQLRIWDLQAVLTLMGKLSKLDLYTTPRTSKLLFLSEKAAVASPTSLLYTREYHYHFEVYWRYPIPLAYKHTRNVGYR